jgi:hypothetical protein
VTLQRFLFNALNGCARKSKKAAIFAWRNFQNWRGLRNRLNKCADFRGSDGDRGQKGGLAAGVCSGKVDRGCRLAANAKKGLFRG